VTCDTHRKVKRKHAKTSGSIELLTGSKLQMKTPFIFFKNISN
jgi:hypothetical protein